MFTIDFLNKIILRNHFITLSNIIILLIAISTALTIKKVETKFNF